MIADRLSVSTEVRAALAGGEPVVAIEWPKETLSPHDRPLVVELVATVRSQGAVPAAVVVEDGMVRIGLETEKLEAFARNADFRKTTAAGLAFLLATGGLGAPTAGASLMLAHLAGISVMCAGGIGGVHRGFGQTMDVSADLEQLARFPVCVVCAGAKAILDIPNTLEYLETRGVPVIGWRTDAFPSYWSRESGAHAPLRIDNIDMLARVACVNFELGSTTGLVVANPIPAAAEIPWPEVQRAVDRALEEARDKGVAGPGVTPFLLKRVSTLMGERTTAANAALLRNNAELAGSLAVAMSRLRTGERHCTSGLAADRMTF